MDVLNFMGPIPDFGSSTPKFSLKHAIWRLWVYQNWAPLLELFELGSPYFLTPNSPLSLILPHSICKIFSYFIFLQQWNGFIMITEHLHQNCQIQVRPQDLHEVPRLVTYGMICCPPIYLLVWVGRTVSKTYGTTFASTHKNPCSQCRKIMPTLMLT